MSAKRKRARVGEATALGAGLDFKRPDLRLAQLRLALIDRAIGNMDQGIFDVMMGEAHLVRRGKTTKGRPREPWINRAVLQYTFDVFHYDTLRALGVANVPSDQTVLDSIIERHNPESLRSSALFERARSALKSALKYRKRSRRR